MDEIDYTAVWNEMCFHVKKNHDVSEANFQKTVEHLFGLIGWSQYKGEVVPKNALPVGSSSNVFPDITIKDNGRAILVVELKKPSIEVTRQNVTQLKSYMRLEKLDFGVLFGESLQLYYDSEEGDELTKVSDIPFVNDLDEGAELIKLLSKNGYIFEDLQKYCINILTAAKNFKKAQEYLELLCSEEGSQIVRDILEEKLSSIFPKEIISQIIDVVRISVSKKEDISTPSQSSISSRIDSNKRLSELADNQKLDKPEAIKLCTDNGINILNKKSTFASLNSNGKTYWANPNKNLLNDDWWILLSDHKRKNIHIFMVPASSISESQMKFRNNGLIEMDIMYDDKSFEDLKSKIKFSTWLLKTVSY
ncbi:MAG: type I restriction enzyme HsdR N-terminal domain-containing protein [Defluviitaleaceae bacterium]|nr:type I restriction enzyme HsdR N-terminal domain-containing protein [Defluviitaleaceae bacterium]